MGLLLLLCVEDVPAVLDPASGRRPDLLVGVLRHGVVAGDPLADGNVLLVARIGRTA